MSPRLNARSILPADIEAPGYVPEDHGVGIVHIGPGAFHKAHQAVYTDTALALAGGDWRITGVSLRSPEAASALNPQDGRYLVIVRDQAGDSARLIGSVANVLVAPQEPAGLLEAIAAASTRIVTLTVTEKAYGIDRPTGRLDPGHEAVAHDLKNPDAPRGVVGLLVAGLKLRRRRDGGALSILCCDNLPQNGQLVRQIVLDFAERIDPALAGWIAYTVSFPSSMVDRITPATTEQTLADAKRMSDVSDLAAVETEPFSQWIVEEDFAAGRPAWDRAGVLFVSDVEPYEKMKLRLLNGTHSLLAYAGFLAGHEMISDAKADEALSALARHQMRANAATLPPVPGIDLEAYQAQLMQRFANRAIRHQTWQVAMDGTEKLAPRIFTPLLELLATDGDMSPFTFVIAAWMRYCLGVRDDGQPYELRDPRQAAIGAKLDGIPREAGAIFDAIGTLGIIPGELVGNRRLRDGVGDHLSNMLDRGMPEAIRRAAMQL